MKPEKGMLPEAKFSSFLKKIPQSGNQISHVDKIISLDKNVLGLSLNNSSDLRNSAKQTANNDTTNFSQAMNTNLRGSEINNNINLNKEQKIKEEIDPHTNEIQYLEREISYEEEMKLKKALMNHFIFQDMTEEIM